jgi:hypothetical protein
MEEKESQGNKRAFDISLLGYGDGDLDNTISTIRVLEKIAGVLPNNGNDYGGIFPNIITLNVHRTFEFVLACIEDRCKRESQESSSSSMPIAVVNDEYDINDDDEFWNNLDDNDDNVSIPNSEADDSDNSYSPSEEDDEDEEEDDDDISWNPDSINSDDDDSSLDSQDYTHR